MSEIFEPDLGVYKGSVTAVTFADFVHLATVLLHPDPESAGIGDRLMPNTRESLTRTLISCLAMGEQQARAMVGTTLGDERGNGAGSSAQAGMMNPSNGTDRVV